MCSYWKERERPLALGLGDRGEEARLELGRVERHARLGRDDLRAAVDERDGGVDGSALGHPRADDLGELRRVEGGHELAVGRHEAEGRGVVGREDLDVGALEAEGHGRSDGR